jgi:hypothetical protein
MALGLTLLLALAPTATLGDGKVTARVMSDMAQVRAGDAFRVGVLLHRQGGGADELRRRGGVRARPGQGSPDREQPALRLLGEV